MRAWASIHVTRLLLVAAVLVAHGSGPASRPRSVAAGGVLGPLHSVRLPDSAARKLGFTALVQIGNESAAGYVPVSITFQAVGTLAADRRLVFRFATRQGGQMPPRRGLVVDVPIELPQGTTTETFVRHLPKWSAGQAIDLSVTEDGRVLEDYTAFISIPLRRGTRSTRELVTNEHQINWVYLSAEDEVSPENMPDLRGILSVDRPIEIHAQWMSITDANALAFWSQNMNGPKLLTIGQKDAPTDWRGYQRYDVVVVNTKGLQRLKSNQPAFRAVRAWVLGGGTVIVYDAPARGSVLKDLNFRDTNDKASTDKIISVAGEFVGSLRSWVQTLQGEVSSLKNHLEVIEAFDESAGSVESGQRSAPGSLVSNDPVSVKAELRFKQELLARYAPVLGNTLAQWGRQIWTQPAGAGQVMGIQRSDDYEVPPPAHWAIAARTLGHRASPTLRRGVDPLIGDRRFTKWMIPGVAQPPVYTFMALLTVFVVLVGPVAYRRTAKAGRGHLMFAIAPVLALFTTVAMFGYGIVSDGFGTIARVRQLTWVDGKSGDAGERVRTTYFAGVRPGEGLRFPGSAEVMGYPEGAGKSWERLNELSPSTIGTIVIRQSSQVFDSSFLPSRQQRQFVVHSPRENVGHARLIPDPLGNSPPLVENGFDFLLHDAVFRDNRGDYWTVQNLAAGENRRCTPLSVEKSSKELGRIYNDHRPLSSVRETRKRQYYRNEIYDVIADANRQLMLVETVTEGTFEHWLQLHLQTLNEIPNDHFVATADVSEDVLAVEGSELSASIRYVFGTLR